MPDEPCIKAKICGLNDPHSVEAAVAGNAAYTGFVFFPPSPRNLEPAKAAELASLVPAHIEKVGVFVDPTDLELALVLDKCPLDIIQLHGTEPVERLDHLGEKFGIRIMKAFPISEERDVLNAAHYEDAADLLLFDAKPPKSMANALPGGNGLVFDWKLLGAHKWKKPWMLSGGMTSDTVADATRIAKARIVDVSSGVERKPGVKDPALIKTFLDIVNGLTASSS